LPESRIGEDAAMSVSPASLAASLISMQSDAARQSLATAMVKQQAETEASVVDLVGQALEARTPGAPPPGQGTLVDISA
jgi:hypothetical protein